MQSGARFGDTPRMDAPELDNRTELALYQQVLADRDGERLVAIVKATFELEAGELVLAPPERMRGVRLADVPWDPEKPASIAYPADVCLRKPATDVAVVGKAYAPGGHPVPSFDVRVQVGGATRDLRIFGARVWLDDGLGLSAPQPIAQLDMRWDHAWGGIDDDDPKRVVEEPRNPVGMGVTAIASALSRRPAPQVEDPAQLISSRDTRPRPAGIGPLGRSFEPRRSFAGTYDEAWLENRAPLLPEDYDDRHAMFGPPGLIATPPLRGGEPVRLINLVPGGGPLAFALPRLALEIAFTVRGREREVFRPHLDTVLVDVLEPSKDKPIAVELIWRASVKAPRRQRDARIAVREVRS